MTGVRRRVKARSKQDHPALEDAEGLIDHQLINHENLSPNHKIQIAIASNSNLDTAVLFQGVTIQSLMLWHNCSLYNFFRNEKLNNRTSNTFRQGN